MEEIWKNIKGYEGFYQISSFGKIKSLRNDKILKLRIGKTGYLYTVFSVNSVRKTVKPHRLIALNFIPNPEFKIDVNHIDGNKCNNRLDNLEWVTEQENVIHAHETGLSKGVRGEKSHYAKISDENVSAIRELFFKYNLSQKHMASYFKISQAQISRIVTFDNRWELKEKVCQDNTDKIINEFIIHSKSIGKNISIKTKRTVLKFDINTNQFISEYRNTIEAGKSINKERYEDVSSSIRSACRGNSKTSYGFKWEYLHTPV